MSPEPSAPITPKQIRDHARGDVFSRAMRGYDIVEVNTFLVKLANQMESFDGTPTTPSRPVAQARPEEDDPYGRFSDRLAEVLKTADQEAERIVREAHEEAERSTAQARAEADRARAEGEAALEEARRQAEELLANAETEAEHRTSSLIVQRDALLEELRDARTKLLGAAQMLGSGSEELMGDATEGEAPQDDAFVRPEEPPAEPGTPDPFSA
jgi:DivIVA domain-containing protein